MPHVEMSRDDDVAVLTLHRGKVNAINPALVRELRSELDRLEGDASARALVLTGHGKFFSFGLDVPELYPVSQEEFSRFLSDFTDLYRVLYIYPKPVVCAINGHAIAGGCMLAIACDLLLMSEGNGKISLNEITFGSTVFAGSVEMLCARTGVARAARVLLGGALYSPREALAVGLVDRVVDPDELLPLGLEEAHRMGSKDSEAYRSIKNLLRGPVVEAMRKREHESIREFIRIWYSESTRRQLRNIQIRE